MAYALHRRAAFRQASMGSGWNFDLTKSEYLDFGVVLTSGITETPGYPLSVGRLFINNDSSSLICQPYSSSPGQRLNRYQFPAGHYGDISHLVNVSYTDRTRSLFDDRRPCAFSPDGLHYVQQGHGSDSTDVTIDGVQINRFDILSCALDSSFYIGIPVLSTMSILKELTSNTAGLAFSSDGVYLLVLFSNTIRSYYLQTPFDVSSASLIYTQVSLSRFSIANVRNWQFSPDGFTLILHEVINNYDTSNSLFHVFRLSAPFNITTLSFVQTWDIGENQVYGFTIDHVGQNLYIARNTTIMQYALSA